ncbi:hypothetical protein [Candidatus Nitrososphaera gargensis]|nr:hypothetical protein [Candidatus Nitrososphaera gargensis]
MNELPLIDVGESGTSDDPRFQCNICGNRADFVVQLELVKGNMKYNALHTEQMPFYLCKAHEYVYKKMQRSIELKDYFTETIKENQ